MLCCGRTLSRLVALRGSAPRQLCSSLSTAIIMAEQGIGPQSGGEYPASDMPASAAGSYDSMEGVAPGQHNQADQHEGERQSEQNAAGSVPEAKPTGIHRSDPDLQQSSCCPIAADHLCKAAAVGHSSINSNSGSCMR